MYMYISILHKYIWSDCICKCRYTILHLLHTDIWSESVYTCIIVYIYICYICYIIKISDQLVFIYSSEETTKPGIKACKTGYSVSSKKYIECIYI